MLGEHQKSQKETGKRFNTHKDKHAYSIQFTDNVNFKNLKKSIDFDMKIIINLIQKSQIIASKIFRKIKKDRKFYQ